VSAFNSNENDKEKLTSAATLGLIFRAFFRIFPQIFRAFFANFPRFFRAFFPSEKSNSAEVSWGTYVCIMPGKKYEKTDQNQLLWTNGRI
jgi:hypothetical protein